MRPHLFPWPLMIVLIIWSEVSLAEENDKTQPMKIEADFMRYEDISQTSIFTGNVVLRKGTIVIKGHKLEVRKDESDFQYAVVTASPKNLTFFRQKREGLQEFMEGESELIEYDGKEELFTFTRRAQLRRLVGVKIGDTMAGPKIIYNSRTEVFTIDGKIEKGSRVRAMLSPKNEEIKVRTKPASKSDNFKASETINRAKE